MGTHNNGTVVLTMNEAEARWLTQSILATPLQGQLKTLAPGISIGLKLVENIQAQLEEHEQRPSENTETV